MSIAVVGIGYVGLVAAACFAEMGNTVVCVDSNAAKIANLKKGRLPIHEPGLDEVVVRNLEEGRLSFTTSLEDAAGSHIFFIAVGTPPSDDGSADLIQVLGVARQLGKVFRGYAIAVTKSTVPVGTAERVRRTIKEEIDARGGGIEFDVVSNPEFLREGVALNDFMSPDRVILGGSSVRAIDALRRVYTPFVREQDRIHVMGAREAEMTKYVSNAMLATKISFMNEIASLCERLGVDVEPVRFGMGADPRIGYAFTYPGCGYGGSCLPKDLKALLHIGETAGVELPILKAVENRNDLQKRRLYDMVVQRFGGDLSGRSFAVWGIAFKPDTDDLREAPFLMLVELLANAGARIQAYDPLAEAAVRSAVNSTLLENGQLTLSRDKYDALRGADALLLVTEWKQFRNPDYDRMKLLLRTPVIFDGRNQYDPAEMVSFGFEYYAIGRGTSLPDNT
jgi:UDPglucose 6-dehydrogenase